MRDRNAQMRAILERRLDADIMERQFG